MLFGTESDTWSIGRGECLMTVQELLKKVVSGDISEAQFMDNFRELFRGDAPVREAEAQCLSVLVEDVNMAEHVGPLFDSTFVRRVEECLRLLTAGASASEIKRSFAADR